MWYTRLHLLYGFGAVFAVFVRFKARKLMELGIITLFVI